MGCCNQKIFRIQTEEVQGYSVETQLENEDEFNDISILTSKSEQPNCSKSTLASPADSPPGTMRFNFHSFRNRTDYEKAFLSFASNNMLK